MSEIPAGAMRFNSDSQKLEYWNGSAWFQVHTATPNLASAGDPTPGARMVIAGGNNYTGPVDIHGEIQYINVASTGNSIDFGANLTQDRRRLAEWHLPPEVFLVVVLNRVQVINKIL